MADIDRHADYFTALAALRVPRVMRAIGWILVIGSLMLVAFLVYVPWVQTSAGQGTVTALNPNDRRQEINALVPGRIQQWFVRDGSHVQEGDPIVEIVDNDPRLIERLQAERDQVVAKLRAAEAVQRTAEIDMRRTRELFDQGLASRREAEQTSIRLEQARSRVAEAAAELTRIEVGISRQSVQTVRAPRDGVILRVNAGDAATFVNTGQVVATFVPDDVDRAIELFIDGRDVALVTPGAPVRLQFEGWPVVQFSGWPSLAVGTFDGVVEAVDPSADVGGRFRVLVTESRSGGTAWPDPRFVRFGAKARGWILLETVPVGYELWRRMNDFPPEFPTAGAGAAGAFGAGN